MLLESGIGADAINQYHIDFTKYKAFLKGVNLGMNDEESVQNTKAQLERIKMKLRQFWVLFEKMNPNHPAHGPKPVAKTPDTAFWPNPFKQEDVLTSLELKKLKQQRGSMQVSNDQFKDNLYNAVKKLESDSQYNDMLFQGLQPNLKKLDKILLKIDLKKDKNGDETFVHRENSLEFSDDHSQDAESPERNRSRFLKTDVVKVGNEDTPENKLKQFYWPPSSRTGLNSMNQISQNENGNSKIGIVQNLMEVQVRASHGFVIDSTRHHPIYQNFEGEEDFDQKISEIGKSNQDGNDDNSLVFTDDNNPHPISQDNNFDSNNVAKKRESSFDLCSSPKFKGQKEPKQNKDEFIEIINRPMSFGRDINAVRVQGQASIDFIENNLRLSAANPNRGLSVFRNSDAQNDQQGETIPHSRITFNQSIPPVQLAVCPRQEPKQRVNMANYFPKHKEMRDKQLELKTLEEEEAKLKAELNSLKAYQCKYKAPERNDQDVGGSNNPADKLRCFKQLLNRSEQESKRARKNKLFINKTYAVDLDEVPGDFLRNLITLNQERVLLARENLGVVEEMIGGQNQVNEFTYLLDKLQLKLTHGQLANVDYSENLMYYHKNLTLAKDLHRLALQNSYLKRLFNDIAKASEKK